MPDNTYNIDLRDIRFELCEVLPFDRLKELYPDVDVARDSLDLLLDECNKFHREVLAPLNKIGDEQGCSFADGKVTVPQGFREAYAQYAEGGWLALTVPEQWGGLGMPHVFAMAVGEMNIGACCSFSLSPGLTQGAGSLIEEYGEESLKKLYLPRLYSGQWQGTMCLTEQNAGSAVGDATTMAVKEGEHWKIRGQKVFISSGDHDMCENHVHLVLARTEGAPKGVKGLSLFIVPKFRPDENGNVGPFNDVLCAGIEHKMGIKASPTCVMSFGESDDCQGWIIGSEGQGLRQMFHMMNHARIGVGLQGLGLAHQAYLYARLYAAERVQGVDIANMRDPDAPRVLINHHPDVRRMLLWCKSVVEGCRALLYRTAFYGDVAQQAEGTEDGQAAMGMLDFLTPICKAYISDMGFEVTRLAMQVLGGYGYVREYPVEQFMRDVKIASLYEGTNGIQALDLMGRKLPSKQGALIRALFKEMDDFVTANKEAASLADDVAAFSDELDLFKKVTMEIATMAMTGDRTYPVLQATPFLQMAGNAVVAWLLLEQAVCAQRKLKAIYVDRGAETEEARAALHQDNPDAQFLFNKVETARFFVYNVLSGNRTIAAQIRSGDRSALNYIP